MRQNVKATHFVYFDINIGGKYAGRLDFELFGEEAPKTVNNFLALASGELDRKALWYGNNSIIHKICANRWIKGGDLVNQNGTGSVTVYGNKQATISAEENNLTFSEPYLLVASANDKGETGSQFFVTLDSMPSLNGSSNTIFGRLLKGTRTLHQIEGYDELARVRMEQEIRKDDIAKQAQVLQ